jgi:radical SAM superfamily enzyme YgiQ (UPF0313 family)/protein-L-isoaspartate O-methyltransferase
VGTSHREPGVLLISPGMIKHTDRDFGLPHMVSMGGYLQRELSVRVELLDLGYEGGDQRQLERTLESLGPHLLIGVSCYSSFDLMRVLVLARFLKSRYPDVPLVAGGYHASALPGDLVGQGAPFDAVIQGEGELPLRRAVETLLGGGALEQQIFTPEAVEELDSLPPYRWELLSRYWPAAHQIAQKLQIYLSRGCPHRCSFCMERAKGQRRWRALSPGRALEELERLARVTKLSRWVVNLADPVFGLDPAWRREVLEGIIERDLRPLQFWTLTRADNLSEQDVELMARAQVSIGVGLESGSPRMLSLMDKTRQPERYLEALERLAGWSRKHRLNWAANIIVGHPGETPESMAETHDVVNRLFVSAPETYGWLSVDPFRLYPGSRIHEQIEAVEQEHGARFHHPRWWRSWYDGAFRAEHLDPGRELDYVQRVNTMYELYSPLVRQIQGRFRGQGRRVDRVFKRSLEEQARVLSPDVRDGLLARARGRTRQATVADAEAVQRPIGLQIADPRVRLREEAVRRLLERGLLRDDALVQALLTVPVHRYFDEDVAEGILLDRPVIHTGEPATLGLSAYALCLEALDAGEGDRLADLWARDGYATALMAALVGPEGRVVAVSEGRSAARKLKSRLSDLPGEVEVLRGVPTTAKGISGQFQALLLGGALPRLPADALTGRLDPDGGRLVTFLGPRFRRQDLVCITRREDRHHERIVARLQAPLPRGPNGWLRR